MDLSHKEYGKYAEELLAPNAIREQVRNTSPSPKFVRAEDGTWQIASFPGHTVITPPFTEDNRNSWLYLRLAEIAERVKAEFGVQNVGSLPLASFHLTVTDLLFGEAFTSFMREGGSEAELVNKVERAFRVSCAGEPIRLRPLGLCATGSAAKLILGFPSKEDYQRVVAFRQAVHCEFGISLREYLAHISLFYKQFDGKSNPELAEVLVRVNEETDWDSFPDFLLHTADLRFFPDMLNFIRDNHWPRYSFDDSERTED